MAQPPEKVAYPWPSDLAKQRARTMTSSLPECIGEAKSRRHSAMLPSYGLYYLLRPRCCCQSVFVSESDSLFFLVFKLPFTHAWSFEPAGWCSSVHSQAFASITGLFIYIYLRCNGMNWSLPCHVPCNGKTGSITPQKVQFWKACRKAWFSYTKASLGVDPLWASQTVVLHGGLTKAILECIKSAANLILIMVWFLKRTGF